MMDTALGTGLPVNVSPKFWAEHMGLPYMQGAIRPQEMPPRNAPNTGFFKLSSGARAVSPLRLRRFVDRGPPLRRAAPHLAGHAKVAAVGRSRNRRRLWPACRVFAAATGWKSSSRFSSKAAKVPACPADATLMPTSRCGPAGDFEKYRYTYRVWGRSLYNPDGDPDGWRAIAPTIWRGAEKAGQAPGLRQPDSAAGHDGALSVRRQQQLLAGDVHATCPSWQREPPHPYTDTPVPRRFGTVSPLDPEFFLGVDEFAAELIAGEASGKYSPAWVAGQLEEAADRRRPQLREAKSKVRDPRQRRISAAGGRHGDSSRAGPVFRREIPCRRALCPLPAQWLSPRFGGGDQRTPGARRHGPNSP